MKLTKSQKICFGLLGAGLCALAYDRLGSEANSAVSSAIESIAVLAGRDGSVPLAAASASSATTETALLTKLAAFHPAPEMFEGVRDAFKPSNTWMPEKAALSSDAANQSLSDDRSDRFRRSHMLKAILHNGGRAQAWVDGSLIEVGQSLDGFRLISIQGLSAVFEADGRRTTLVLPDGTAEQRSADNASH